MLWIVYDFIHFSNSIITHNSLIYVDHAVATILHSYRSFISIETQLERTDYKHELARNVCRIAAQVFPEWTVNSESTSIMNFFHKKHCTS